MKLQMNLFEFIVKSFFAKKKKKSTFFGSINFFWEKENHFKHVNFITIFISNISQHHLYKFTKYSFRSQQVKYFH